LRIGQNFVGTALLVVTLASAGCAGPSLNVDSGADGSSVSPLLAGSAGAGSPHPIASASRQRSRSDAVGPSQQEVFSGLEQRGSGEFTARGGFTNVAIPDRLANGAEGITLNLLNVPLAQAAKSVLGDVLKVNYSIADKLTGNITIQTSAPMHRDAVIEVFESALKVNGAALVRSADGHYRIVPSASAAQSGARFANARPSGPGTQIRVLALKYVSPSEMRRIIDPIAPQGSIVSVDDARNLLVVAAGANEIGDIDRLVATFDVDWMRGMSVAFYPVKSSDPESIARELETVMGLDKDGPLKGTVRILPNRRLSSIMVVSSRPGPLDTARKWIQQLDRVAETSEEQLFVYKTRNRSAIELANLLSKVITTKDAGPSGGAAGPSVAPRFEPTTLTTESPAPAAAGANRGIGSSTLTAPGSTTPAAPGSAAPVGSAGLTPPATATTQPSEPERATASPSQATGRSQRIVPDEANSALVITATRKEYDRMLQILDRLDNLPTQVMLEAVIAEVTLNDELKFGVKWALGGAKNKATLSDNASGTIASNFPGFSYFLLANSVTAAIDAVSSITKVNVVSAPSLMVLDNRKASLQIGDQVPIVTQSAANTVVVGGPIVNSVVLKDTGIILSVTPHVSDGGRVVLDIEQEVSSATKTTSSGIDSPTIQQRRIKTTVVVGNGETVALGGLIQERDNATKSGVPLLGEIPVLGTIFRQKSDQIDRTELLIFIRPLVVRDQREAREVTEEFRQRIHVARPTSTTGRNVYDRDAMRILH
jgi:general secretion pathway protein D